MNFAFDSTVTLGNILTILTIFCGGLVFMVTLREELHSIGNRVKALEGTVSRVTDALIQIAKQEERLNYHAQRLDRMEQR